MVNNNLNIQLPESKIGKSSPKMYEFSCFATGILYQNVPQKINNKIDLVCSGIRNSFINLYQYLSINESFSFSLSYLLNSLKSYLLKAVKNELTALRVKNIPITVYLDLIIIATQQFYY